MSLLDFFRRSKAPAAGGAVGHVFAALDDPALLEYIRLGVNGGDDKALRNMAVLRCAGLIAGSIGMLPLNLLHTDAARGHAEEHPAYRLMKRCPNSFQTPREFKSLLTLRALLYGNGYARVIRAAGRPVCVIPLTGSVKPHLSPDWRMQYDVSDKGGATQTLDGRDVLHLRDLSLDGIEGKSRIALAGETLALSRAAQQAASNVFNRGVMAGGALEFPQALSDTAYARMRESLDSRYTGPDGAGRWMLVEEGGKANQFSTTPQAAQQVENRNHQIEEVARLFGVPRPLLMMDDTSWGSGIEQLAIFFVQYTLAPWFNAWEEALARVFLGDADDLVWKFNERALLRGTLKDQADFFAKALGAGGHGPWMTQNEVRGLSDMPAVPGGNADQLRNPMTEKTE